jgi:hypothetical protein
VRDVARQVVGAVDKAERSFNDGLKPGHIYGAGHPPIARPGCAARPATP